ncbi:hypothetical protein, partial [Sinorhizobium meliloti]
GRAYRSHGEIGYFSRSSNRQKINDLAFVQGRLFTGFLSLCLLRLSAEGMIAGSLAVGWFCWQALAGPFAGLCRLSLADLGKPSDVVDDVGHADLGSRAGHADDADGHAHDRLLIGKDMLDWRAVL